MGQIRDDVYAEEAAASKSLAQQQDEHTRRGMEVLVHDAAARWLAAMTQRRDLEARALVIGRDVLSNPEDTCPKEAAAGLAVDLIESTKTERVALMVYGAAANEFYVNYGEPYRG